MKRRLHFFALALVFLPSCVDPPSQEILDLRELAGQHHSVGDWRAALESYATLAKREDPEATERAVAWYRKAECEYELGLVNKCVKTLEQFEDPAALPSDLQGDYWVLRGASGLGLAQQLDPILLDRSKVSSLQLDEAREASVAAYMDVRDVFRKSKAGGLEASLAAAEACLRIGVLTGNNQYLDMVEDHLRAYRGARSSRVLHLRGRFVQETKGKGVLTSDAAVLLTQAVQLDLEESSDNHLLYRDLLAYLSRTFENPKEVRDTFSLAAGDVEPELVKNGVTSQQVEQLIGALRSYLRLGAIDSAPTTLADLSDTLQQYFDDFDGYSWKVRGSKDNIEIAAGIFLETSKGQYLARLERALDLLDEVEPRYREQVKTYGSTRENVALKYLKLLEDTALDLIDRGEGARARLLNQKADQLLSTLQEERRAGLPGSIEIPSENYDTLLTSIDNLNRLGEQALAVEQWRDTEREIWQQLGHKEFDEAKRNQLALCERFGSSQESLTAPWITARRKDLQQRFVELENNKLREECASVWQSLESAESDEEAIGVITENIERITTSAWKARLLRKQSELEYRIGDYTSCRETLEGLKTLDQQDKSDAEFATTVEDTLRYASCLYHTEHYAVAALEYGKKHVNLLRDVDRWQAAFCFLEARKPAEARAVLEQSSPDARRDKLLSRCYQALYEEAEDASGHHRPELIELLERWVEADPDQSAARHRLAELYYERGRELRNPSDLTNAWENLRRVHSIKPGSGDPKSAEDKPFVHELYAIHADYLPLQVDNVWTYRASRPSQNGTWEAYRFHVLSVENGVYAVQKTINGQNGQVSEIERWEKTGRILKRFAHESGTLIRMPIGQHLPEDKRPRYWPVKQRRYKSWIEGNGQDSGEFANCLRVKVVDDTNPKPATFAEFTFAPEVGIVEFTIRNQVFKLVHFQHSSGEWKAGPEVESRP